MEPRPHADDINNIMRLSGDHQTQPNLIVDRSRRRRGGGRKRNNSPLSLSLSAHVIGRRPKKGKWNSGPASNTRLIETMLSHLDRDILFRLETFRKLVRMFQLKESKGCFEKIKMIGVLTRRREYFHVWNRLVSDGTEERRNLCGRRM